MKRRDFMKTTVAVASATLLSSQESKAARVETVKINKKAKAVMPDGSKLSRQEILQELGLDPHTSPDAWLNIIACGLNASALTPKQLQEALKKGKLRKDELDTHSLKKLNMRSIKLDNLHIKK